MKILAILLCLIAPAAQAQISNQRVLSEMALPFALAAGESAGSITNYGYPPGNALRYGCDATGTISSTTCIAALGAYLHALGGGTGTFPPGTYLTSGNSFPYGGLCFKGAGTDATTIVNTSTNTPALTFGDGTNQYFGGCLEGIRFGGKAGVTGVNGQTAFTFQKIGQFRVQNVTVSNFPNALYRGAYFVNDSQFVVYNLQVQSVTLDGFTNIGGVDAYVTDTRSDANGGSGYVLNNSQGGYYKSVTAFGNAANGWNLTSTAPASSVNANNTYVNCVGDTSGADNWLINDSKNSYFISAWGSSQISTGVNTSAVGFDIVSQYSTDLYFTGGIAVNNNSHGVKIHDSGSSAPARITFTNFQFGSTVNGANGNGKSGGTAYGLFTDGAVNSIRLNGGGFSGNLTGPYLNSSSGSDYSIANYPMGMTTAWSSPGFSIDNNGAATLNSTWTFSPTGGNAILANGVAGSYAVRIVGNATTGSSKGLILLAGTNASDSAMQIANQTNTVTYANFFGDGGVAIGSPTGGDKGLGGINAIGVYANGSQLFPVLTGTSATITPGALVANTCNTATTTTLTGATTAMAVAATPVTYPGDMVSWPAWVSSANTISIKVCSTTAQTPVASAYNIRVLQ